MQDSEKVTELDPHVTHEIINCGDGTSENGIITRVKELEILASELARR